MSQPVSVVMPVRNAAPFLDAAIESIIQQTHRDWRLLAIDDGSSDGSLDMLERWSRRDARISVLRSPGRGISCALNAGLAAAETELVARLDADDLMLPHRLEHQVSLMSQQSGLLLLAGCVDAMDAEGVSLGRTFPSAMPARLLRWRQACGNIIVHSTTMYRRRIAMAVGGYRTRDEPAEDYGLWRRMLAMGPGAVDGRVVCRYRIHAQQVSQHRAVRQCLVASRIQVESIRGSHGPSERTPQRQPAVEMRLLASRHASAAGCHRPGFALSLKLPVCSWPDALRFLWRTARHAGLIEALGHRPLMALAIPMTFVRRAAARIGWRRSPRHSSLARAVADARKGLVHAA